MNAFAGGSENRTTVIIAPEAESILDYIVEQIISENPDAGVINIYEYGDINNINEVIDNKHKLMIKIHTGMEY